MTFRTWLERQKERKDNIGRLARLMDGKELRKRSSRRRKPDEHRRWVRTIVQFESQAVVHTFNEAWQEYQKVTAS